MVETIAHAWVYVLQREVVGAIAVPSVLVAGATAVRWTMGLPFTSWADTLMAVAAFDGAAILDNNVVRGLLTNSQFSGHIGAIHFYLMSIAAIAWFVVVGVSEKPLTKLSETNRHGVTAMLRSGVGCVLAGILVAVHVLTYIAGSANQ